MRTLVIIPTYNEKDNISLLLQNIIDDYQDRVDILIVDDNSPDGTATIVCTFQQTHTHIFLLERPGKQGLASAYIDGFQYAIQHGYDVVLQMDADLSHDPSYIAQFLEKIKKHDVVVGSRYIQEGKVATWSIFRRGLSFFGNLYARVILGMRIHDVTGGYNCWKVSVLHAISLDTIQSQGYSFQVELKHRAQLQGYTMTEIPIVFADRTSGKSKFSKYIFFEAMWRVWWMKWLAIQRHLSKKSLNILYLTILFVLGSFIFFWHVGVNSVQDWDEGIYSLISYETFTHPSLTLTLHGEPWFEKPPLGFFLQAVSFRIFGVNEFAVRSPSSVYLLCTIFVVYFFGKALFKNTHIAFVSALFVMMMPSLLFDHMARSGDLDSGLLLCATLSLYFLYRSEYVRSFLYWASLFAGIGLMIRGSSALFIPIIGGAYLFLTGRWKRIPLKEYLWAILLYLAIVLPWHIQQLIVHGRAFWDVYVLEHFLSRISTPIQNHAGLWNHYFVYFHERDGLFFSLAVCAFFYHTFRWFFIKKKEVLLMLLWLVLTLVPLMIMKTKLYWYGITLIVPMVYLVVYMGVDVLALIRRHVHGTYFYRSAMILCVLIAMGFLSFFGNQAYRFVTMPRISSPQNMAEEFGRITGGKSPIVIYHIGLWIRGSLFPQADFYFMKKYAYDVYSVDIYHVDSFLFDPRYEYFLTDQAGEVDLRLLSHGTYRFREVSRAGDLVLLQKIASEDDKKSDE